MMSMFYFLLEIKTTVCLFLYSKTKLVNLIGFWIFNFLSIFKLRLLRKNHKNRIYTCNIPVSMHGISQTNYLKVLQFKVQNIKFM